MKPSLSASMVSPSSMLPSQSSSMPLQTSAAAGLTLESKSSQSGMVPTRARGVAELAVPVAVVVGAAAAADTAVVRRSVAVIVDAIADFRGCGIDVGIEVVAIVLVPWQELKLVKPSLSASMVSPSSMLPSQSSSMPLADFRGCGLTLESKSSQSSWLPCRS